MTINAKTVQRQLRDLADWAPLLTDTTTTLTTPRANASGPHTTGTIRDLGDLIAPTLDAPDQGAAGIRTNAQITEWATAWANGAELHYASGPLRALADNAPRLAENWDDWDSFTDDLQILHHRIARMTGHAPRTIGPCPTSGCGDTVTQAQTRRGAEGPLECPRGHTYKDETAYLEAVRDADRAILQDITDPTIRVTISQFLHAWPTLTKDDIKNWTRTGRISLSDTTPRTLNLATANILARQLIEYRKKADPTPNGLAS